MSPFCELYQMVKQDLTAKSPWKSELPKTPLARPQVGHKKVLAADVKSSPIPVPTLSTKKRRSSKANFEYTTGPAIPQSSMNANVKEKATDDMPSVGSSTPTLMEKNVTPVSQKKKTPSKTPQKFTAGEVAQQVLLVPQPEERTPKSPKGRRSGGLENRSLAHQIPPAQPQTPSSEDKNTEVKMSPRTSPRANAGKRFQVQNVLPEITASTSAIKQDDTSVNKQCDGVKSGKVSIPKSKKKRVSFGGQLSPELFDKRLPPNSPLQRGATPRRSLGLCQKPQSLLRRASTMGLMALRLAETFPEAQKSSPTRASPKQRASPAKTPSPGKKSPSAKAKTPSPAKRSPSTKAKTPSPKLQKSPSAKRASASAIEVVGDMSINETPRVQGRFSVSRISTPSPIQDQGDKPEPQSSIVEDVPQKCVTPKIPLRRKSMKSSARKTPKSAIKSALDVMRSRRSGASRANLRVLTSWADIVKFGQIKPQPEVITKKKTTKSSIVKRTAVPKPKTPARRLKDDVSTGHAASPITVVVGKAQLRTNQSVGAAPKIVPNIALFKKDMKMDEDLTGVAEIFKTPANIRSMNRVPVNNECPDIPLDEISVMKTPEESGEMIVSPLSVVSTAKRGCYNNEAVTRLFLENQDGSLLEDEGLSQLPQNSNEANCHDIIPNVEMPSDVEMEEEEAAPEAEVKTPQQKAAPSSCLTGVKRIMKTPKQKAEPIEDLRGKLLKTPKECKPSQDQSLEGVKELLKTPKYRGAPVEDMVGVKRVMQTLKEKNNPVLCAAGLQRLMRTPIEKTEQHEDLTGVKELMKTPKIKGAMVENKLGLKRLVKTPKQKRNQVEEDLTGVQHLMKTPKHKGEPVEDQMGVQRLMQTPKEKVEPVEDFSGLKQLMQTPKQKGDPVSSQLGIGDLMKTPEEIEVVAQDSTGLKELETEKSSYLTTESKVTELTETQEPVEIVSAFTPVEGLDEECDKENVCPVETLETEVVKSVDLQCMKEVESNQSDQDVETVISQEVHHEESVSVESTDAFSSGADEKTQEQSEEPGCVSDNTNTPVETTSASSTAEQEELIKSPPANKIQRGTRGRAAQKSKNEMAKAPAVLALIEEENMSSPIPASPTRGRRGKKLLEVPEMAASPVRKSARGRVPKHSFVEEEVKNTEASQVLAESINTAIPDSLPVVTKTRKGRKAKQDDTVAAVVPTIDASAVDPQCANAREEQVQAPVVKPGRRKKVDKVESQPSEELEQKPTEIVFEENAVEPGDVKLTSLGTEAVSATRARRGRLAKREHLKTKPTPGLENEISSTSALVVAEKPLTPVAKSGRGRKGKKEIVMDEPLEDDSTVVSRAVSEVDVDHKEDPQTLVKSGRGRKAKQQKPETAEEVVDQPAVDTSTHLPVTEEHTETVAKSVRGNRKTKQSKVTISVEIEENIVSPVEQAETPVVKSGRKRAIIAKESETVADVSVKRGRRAVADPAPSVAVVSSRARKAVVKAETEVTEDVALSEEPVKPVKHTRRTAKAPNSKKEENTMSQADSELVAVENTTVVALEKVERGSRGKKQKDSTKDIPKNPIKESATAEETNDMKPSKMVNWSTDLVVCKDIENCTDVKEPPLKKSKRSGKLPAETASTESNQAADLPPRGRRGRGAKKEEPPVEDSQDAAHEKVKPLRRGKAVAPSAPKSEVTESKTSTPLKRKRIEVPDESVNKEPLPKRRGRVANSAEVTAEVSSKDKTSAAEPEKAEPTPKKTANRAARGQKRTAQEPDPAPAKAQESVSGTTTRKGRSVKKVEEIDVPTEAAPLRRTRRK
ncbi:proliferation marker protein Ki-67 isoform X2 [Puntigrus tetrazona]|nr:proliferation marker protein Ki-67 isoform X2 [Puntigrus tetrazona]